MQTCIRASVIFVIGYIAQVTRCENDRNNERDSLAAESVLTVVGEPNSATVWPGATAELQCEVFGAPVPSIQWLHNGKRVRTIGKTYSDSADQLARSPVMEEVVSNRNAARTFQMATTSSKLRLPCATHSQAGLYSCVASNGVETITVNATLRIQGKGNAVQLNSPCTGKSLGLSPPEIYMWTDSRMERPGASVQLMCRASGMPVPNITWYETRDAPGGEQRRTAIRRDDERFVLLSSGDLLIKKIPDHSPLSMYRCEATNALGKEEVTSMLLEIIDDTTTVKRGLDQQEV